MKKFFVLSVFVVLAACNSNEPTKTAAMTDSVKPAAEATMPAIKSPYPIGYSSDFEKDDPKNAETLLALWKVWENGDLTASKDMFADSVQLIFSDGSSLHSSRDSVIAAAQKFRNTFASSISSVDAVMATKSVDKNEHWALIWGKEVNTDKKGKVDSSHLQETWRFNKDGKADLMFQYRQAIAPPKK
ncbi:MAG TPA: hypothetical protein VIJ92_04660 [Ginsengibacter sp.]